MKKHGLFGWKSIVAGGVVEKRETGDTCLYSTGRSMCSEAAEHHPDG